jgi:hypothetical protein
MALVDFQSPSQTATDVPEWALDIAEAGQELLNQFGDSVTFISAPAGVEDTETFRLSLLPPTTWTVNCYIRDYTDQEINGNTVIVGDRELMVMGDSRLYQGMNCTVLGVTKRIQSMKRKGSGVYDLLQVR